MSSNKAKDVRRTQALKDWGTAVKNLLSEQDLKVDETINVALLTSMVPYDLTYYLSVLKFELAKDTTWGWRGSEQRFTNQEQAISA